MDAKEFQDLNAREATWDDQSLRTCMMCDLIAMSQRNCMRSFSAFLSPISIKSIAFCKSPSFLSRSFSIIFPTFILSQFVST